MTHTQKYINNKKKMLRNASAYRAHEEGKTDRNWSGIAVNAMIFKLNLTELNNCKKI